MASPKIPPDEKTFSEMIGNLNSIGGEPRSTVLITHLYIEYLLDWILRRKITKPNKIITRASFYSKLELIESFDILFDGLMHDLWIVNKIRNQFAHNIDIGSPDFEKDFAEKLRSMEYYKNTSRYDGVTTYDAYYMVMIQIYSLLKNCFDALPKLNTDS